MIIEKFEKQVQRYSQQIAVISENRKLTYEELNREAEKTAAAVRRMGESVTPDGKTPVVGLLFQHSTDMIVAVLGTLKAEKAYLPLDITYPENRIAYMLEDSGASLILTNNDNIKAARRLAKSMEVETGQTLPILSIDDIDDIPAEEPPFSRTPSGDRLAYILYTSGSTGKPKGVMQTNRGVCYYIRNWTSRFSITSSDRMTLFTAFSHDGAGQDMFSALHNGAVLYPYNILARPNISGLIRWLKEEKITIWHSVPTIYRYFVNTLAEKNKTNSDFPHLRFILLGGEAVRMHDIDMFKRFFPAARFANVYGQTESSVNTIWTLGADDLVNKMLIGDPLDETEIILMDTDGEIVEDIGVGEIIVSCEYLSPGYWNNEAGTREKFLQDSELGRLYRTGDLGRLLSDGSIEIMGRKDAQVKIRGFRIETGEIETRLLQYEGIKEAVVVVKTDERGEPHLCAYYVPVSSDDEGITVTPLREYLSGEVPEYMVPSHFVRLDALPVTPNGKIDRKKLPDPDYRRRQTEVNFVAPETPIEEKITTIWKEILHQENVGVNDNFFELGGTSFDIIKMSGLLYETFNKEVPVVTVFQFPTIRALGNYLSKDEKKPSSPALMPTATSPKGKGKGDAAARREGPSDIAVIGMSCRLPGAGSVDQYWENLKDGVKSISFFTKEELIEAGNPPADVENPNYVPAKGIIGDVDHFDAVFFNYSPMEAKIMDPQVRVLHEICWEALEKGGYDPDTYDGNIGLYAGNANNSYWLTLTAINQIGAVDSGFLLNNYTTVVSYKLNLKGPSFVVQCACSTSLVAIHLACQGLMEYECDMALAGGVSVWFPEVCGYVYQEGMVNSMDGYVRTFDANASGTVFGNGAGIVLLKRLEDALADGDPIDAVIKGSGINNDGHRKVGLPSPSVEGQSDVIGAVYRNSGISPETISYMEAHGTGTVLGDPVEIEALKLAFNTDKKQYCRIGSAKTNIGHLNVAAGVAGFIKAVLCLKHRQIPPSLNFEIPNPRIDFKNSPFVVNTKLTQWRNDEYPLRAAVSAFGIGGTNSHAILEEAPARTQSSPGRALQLILLSAASKTAMEKQMENLTHHLQRHPELNLADVAFTLQVGRRKGRLRKMFLCGSTDELVTFLQTPDEQITPETGKLHKVGGDDDRPVVFMFSGQGAQYESMGLELYETEPVFRREMDRCFTLLKPLLGFDLKAVLYPGFSTPEDAKEIESVLESDERPDINQTRFTQPVLFIFEYALARMLMTWGFTPFAMIGHSIGEYTAACLSGVFSLEDALRLVVLRGKLMQQLPGGSMMGVSVPEKDLKPLLPENVSLAAVNTTAACVVSGTDEAIDAFEKKLTAEGINCRRLHTSHAFHSAMMDPILEEFTQTVSQIKSGTPLVPYISNVTGTWITREDAADPRYWTNHLRGTVRFADGLTELLKTEGAVFLEVGPGRTLNTFVQQHGEKNADHVNVNLVRHPKEDISDSYYLFSKIGRLWLSGKSINWRGFYSEEKRQRVLLPTYPFQKQAYRLEGNPFQLTLQKPGQQMDTGKQTDLADWFHVPTWKTSLPLVKRAGSQSVVDGSPENWLIFLDDWGIGAKLADRLTDSGHDVTVIERGSAYHRESDFRYTINPTDPDDYRALFNDRAKMEKPPHRILHLWNVGPLPELGAEPIPDLEENAFYSLLYLARAVPMDREDPLYLYVISDGMQAVMEGDAPYPQKTLIAGPLQVIPQEYSNIRSRSIDILPVEGRDVDTQSDELVEDLVEELINQPVPGNRETFIALRNRYRWVRDFEAVHPQPPAGEIPGLREGGVYLVTGGLGGIGLVLSQYLARKYKAKLALIGRTPLPEREQWDQWLRSHPETDTTSARIREVQKMEKNGGEVLVLSADVADIQQMGRVVDEVSRQLGSVNGVIHAAGVADGGLIQVRNREMSQKVFASKVTGSLILDALFKDADLDFLMLCSSVSAVTGTIGQVAYTSANAFMDALAYYRTRQNNGYTVSVNWDAWQQVGMAAAAADRLSGGRPRESAEVIEVDYPLFDRCERYGRNQSVYVATLSPKTCWFLDEHRVQGRAVLPGTGYLEIASACATHHLDRQAIQLKDFYITTPLMLEDDEEKEIRVVVKSDGPNFTISILSRVTPGMDAWMEHARAIAIPVDETETSARSLDEIRAICSQQEKEYDPAQYNGERGMMTFGPRWNCLRHANFGPGRALGLIRLPETIAADVNDYRLHPSILDAGNVFLRRAESNDPYVPIYYKSITIYHPLPSSVYYDFRDAPGNKPDSEILKFNITIMDETGKELVVIEEYTLKRITNQVASGAKPGRTPDRLIRPFVFYAPYSAGSSADAMLKDAISPKEGVDVFQRILAGDGWPQVVVSAIDFNVRLKMKAESADEGSGDKSEESEDTSPKLARPDLSTDYVAPQTETEKQLAPIWEELLGIDQVGIFDDFFELGGDSLKAVTFGARIYKKLNSEVPISEFFTRPNIKLLARYVDENREEGSTGGFTTIEPVEKKEYYPLSAAQKRLYILNRLEGSHTGYNLANAKLIDGEFDIQRMESAFRELILRHDVLRTSFAVVAAEPVQVIHEQIPFEVAYFDCTASTSQNSSDPMTVDDIIRDFIKPFDLEKPPLFRVGIIKISENSRILITDFHHIVFDGISFTLLYQEFAQLYTGATPAPLPLTYKDYSQWQTSHDRTGEREKEEAFWLDVFADEPPILSLPFDFPRPQSQRFDGSSISFVVDAQQTNALRKLIKQSDATLFMVFLSVVNILLSKLSGQEDIVVGTPVGGRNHTDLEKLLGMFVNTIALRNYPQMGQPFSTFLKDVKDRSLKSFQHQEYPFEILVEHVVTDRDMSRNPLFDVMFIVNAFASERQQSNEEKENAQLEFTNYNFKKQASQFDLTIVCFDRGQTLDFNVEYCTALFKEETVQRFIDYFNVITAAILENPEIKLSDIDVMSDGEKELLLVQLNDTQLDYSSDKTIHQLFQECVQRFPDEIALKGRAEGIGSFGDPLVGSDDEKNPVIDFTYSQLHSASGRLAAVLRERGIRPGAIAAIMVERTPAMMVGMLAIMKAGGAYIPLDPEYPDERINFILEKSEAQLLVTEKYLLDKNPRVNVEIETVYLKEELNENDFNIEPPAIDHDAAPDDPAYIIYTSGSTGDPKGVMVSHRNAVNFIAGMTDMIDFAPGRTILALTTISFDIFFLETLLPITLGMTVAIADENQQKDPTMLEKALIAHNVDMVQMTPSRLQLMLNMGGTLQGLENVEILMVGGEAFPGQLFRRVKDNFNGKIYNMYGPTETTIWSAVKDLTDTPADAVTIGKPIANTQVYIVDKALRMQPPGVPGELLIGGDGVALGYAGNDSLTREKFISDPYREGGRLYRTGDLARWLPDGDIQFLGRMDHQVKIRGFRVELEEIEEQLIAVEGIKEAVVVLKSNPKGDKYLCAYLVPEASGAVPETSQLKEVLAVRLPNYMIPAHFVTLEAIPLTPNGKINRRALPDPDMSTAARTATFVAPGTGNEMKIAEIWKEILQIEEIGVEDNFFDLGGNSLNVVQLNWKLKETFDVDIPVAVLFRNLTIRFIDEYMNRDTAAEAEKEAKRAQSLDKSKKKYKDTMKKFARKR